MQIMKFGLSLLILCWELEWERKYSSLECSMVQLTYITVSGMVKLTYITVTGMVKLTYITVTKNHSLGIETFRISKIDRCCIRYCGKTLTFYM